MGVQKRQSTPFSLKNVDDGNVIAEFDSVLKELVSNVNDDSYPAKAKRVAVLTVEFEPNEQRNFVTINYGVQLKLPAKIKRETTSLIDGDNLIVFARGLDPEREVLPGINPEDGSAESEATGTDGKMKVVGGKKNPKKEKK